LAERFITPIQQAELTAPTPRPATARRAATMAVKTAIASARLLRLAASILYINPPPPTGGEAPADYGQKRHGRKIYPINMGDVDWTEPRTGESEKAAVLRARKRELEEAAQSNQKITDIITHLTINQLLLVATRNTFKLAEQQGLRRIFITNL
jgi:hypothetical protein